MWCNQQFSLLEKTSSVDYIIRNNIVCDNYETASQLARAEYGADAIALDTTLYPVGIGYTYVDGTFYDFGGNVIPKNPTEAEQIDALNHTIEELQATIASQDEVIADILLSL